MKYNPFQYLHSEKDILKMVTTLMVNTKGDGKDGDEFWQKAEKLLYTALIGYIYYMLQKEVGNLACVEVIDYNRKNEQRERSNEAHQKERQQERELHPSRKAWLHGEVRLPLTDYEEDEIGEYSKVNTRAGRRSCQQ